MLFLITLKHNLLSRYHIRTHKFESMVDIYNINLIYFY